LLCVFGASESSLTSPPKECLDKYPKPKYPLLTK